MPGTYAMPMRLLRQYLMPESAQSDGPALTPDELQKWVAALPQDKPLEAARALADVAERIRLREPSVRKRIRLYDLMHETAGQVMQVIEAKLGRASLPLSPLSEALLEQGNRLLREFGVGYTSIAIDVSGKWVGLGYARPLRNATLRGMQSHARRLMLCYRVYSEGSRTAWASMHQLYRIARDGGFVAETLDGRGVPIEQIYRRALLIAFADPARLAPGELDRVRFYVERYGDLAAFATPDSIAPGKAAKGGLFLIRPSDTVAGRSLAKWHVTEPAPHDLILDCSALNAKVAEHIVGLESNIVPAQLGLPIVARQPQYLAMLKSMMGGWGAPSMRRFHRARFHPRVDLVAGFEGLWTFLSGPAYRRRQHERHDVEIAADETSEWAILNESPGGFALRLVAGGNMKVGVGEVVAIRPHERGTVQACMTRRALSARGRKLVMGLEVLASRPVPVTISVAESQSRQRGARRDVRAILLLKVPPHDNAPALIAAPDTVWPGIEVTVTIRGRRTRLRVSRRLEKTATAELYLLERGSD